MDWLLIVPPVLMCVGGYFLGRAWSIKEYIELQEKYHLLERDYRKISTRGPDGRFTKPD